MNAEGVTAPSETEKDQGEEGKRRETEAKQEEK